MTTIPTRTAVAFACVHGAVLFAAIMFTSLAAKENRQDDLGIAVGLVFASIDSPSWYFAEAIQDLTLMLVSVSPLMERISFFVLFFVFSSVQWLLIGWLMGVLAAILKTALSKMTGSKVV